jgi:hypothetical protein
VLPALALGIILQRWGAYVAYGMSVTKRPGQTVEIRSPVLGVLLLFFALGETAAMLAVFLWPPPRWLTVLLTCVIWFSLIVLVVALVPLAVTKIKFRK